MTTTTGKAGKVRPSRIEPAAGPVDWRPAPRLQAAPLRILCSYHYFRDTDMEDLSSRFHHPPQIFADSGGFSAFTQDVTIEPDHYAKWLKRWRKVIHVAANIDDLHDPVKTWRNHQRLETLGLNPIPVFHLGSHFDWLRKYLDAGYTYIALGKMVGRPLPAVMRWAIQCHKIAAPYSAQFHGFGLTRTEAIEALPFYSVDSASWSAAQRFGRVMLWDESKRAFDAFNLWDRAGVMRLASLIRKAGYDPRTFIDKAKYHRSYAIGLSASAWLDFEDHLRRRHGAIPCPPGAERHFPDAATTGPDLYLAMNTECHDLRQAGADREFPRRTIPDGPHLYLAASGGDPIGLMAAGAGPVADGYVEQRQEQRNKKGTP